MPQIPQLPIDNSFKTVMLFPAIPALEETYDPTVSTSTEITLNTSTTLISVLAIDKPIFMKWGTSDASSTDWDHVLAAGIPYHFPVAIDPTTGAKYTAVNFIEQAASAILAMSEF